MKKKLIAVLLCSTLLFSFTACGGSDSKTDDNNKPAVSATPEAGGETTNPEDSSKENEPGGSEGETTPTQAPDGADDPGTPTDPDSQTTSTPAPGSEDKPGTTDPETTTAPETTTDPGNVSTDSRSLKGLEDHLLKAGVLSGSREEVDPSFLGAVAGVRYPDSHVEIYEFDPNSENFKILNEGEGIEVTGKDVKYYYADSTTDKFVLVAIGDADTEDIANAFGLY